MTIKMSPVFVRLPFTAMASTTVDVNSNDTPLKKDEATSRKWYKNKFFIIGTVLAIIAIVVLVVVLVVVLKDDDDDNDVEDLNGPEVLSTSYGKLQGRKQQTVFNEMDYYSFRGIKYADVPGRFQEAIPITSWDNTYDATENKPVCIQIPESDKEESEDCLFLNVYTPKLSFTKDEKRLPVMFWIHGGTFIAGDAQSTHFGADHLLDEDVVVVSTNYRLGVFGFMSTGDSKLPGNLGIKDIFIALQWVQDNIYYFGGDPEQVTIFGESAGGALVSYITQSPLIKGKKYFTKAIAQSGTSLCPWALQSKPMRVLESVSKLSGCTIGDVFDVNLAIECLKVLDLENIRRGSLFILGLDFLINFDIMNGISFAPIIEQPSDTAVVVHESYRYLHSDDLDLVPMLIGGTSEEGLGVYDMLKNNAIILAEIDLKNSILVLDDLYIEDDATLDETAKAIKQSYYGRLSSVRLSETWKTIKYISDSAFNKPLRENFEAIQDKSETYCYTFSYGPDHGIDELGRAQHASELPYLFRITDDDRPPLIGDEIVLAKRIARFWANYAKYGNPTPEDDPILQNIKWPRARQDRNSIKCVDINSDLSIIANPFEEKYRMWKDLYTNNGHPRDSY